MALIQGKSGAEVGIGYMLSYNGGIWKLESCYLSSSVTERWLAPQHRPVREIRRVLGACRKDCQEGLEWGLELTEVQDWTPLPVTQRGSAWHVPQASRASSVRNDISYCLNRNFDSYSHNSPNKYTQKEGKPQRVALGMHIKMCQKLYIGQAFSSGAAFPLPSSHYPGRDRSKHCRIPLIFLAWQKGVGTCQWCSLGLDLGDWQMFSASLLFPAINHAMAAAVHLVQVRPTAALDGIPAQWDQLGCLLLDWQKPLGVRAGCPPAPHHNKGVQNEAFSTSSVTSVGGCKDHSVRAGEESVLCFLVTSFWLFH